MGTFANSWNSISTIGLRHLPPEADQRPVMLVNRLSAFMAVIILAILVADLLQFWDDYRHFRVPAQHIIFALLSAFLPFLLNAWGKHSLAKIVFSIVPPFILMLYPAFFGYVKEEFFFWLPYAAVALSIISHFIFSWKEERIYYLIPIIFCFLVTVFSEEILNFFHHEHLPVEAILAQSIVFQKLARIFIFLFINLSIAYFIKMAFDKENQLHMVNAELQEQAEMAMFQSAEVLNHNVRLKEQQEEIESQNEELHEIQDELNVQNEELNATLEQLRYMQQQLIQSEKMASVGVLTAGIAHEINNPINFISSGVDALRLVLSDFQRILQQYDTLNEKNYHETLAGIQEMKNKLGYEEMLTDVDRLTGNISNGVSRVTEIIRSLRIFSRLDKEEMSECNLNEFLDSALVLLFHQYKNRIEIQRNLGSIPVIQCNPVQINQVFVNILINAIDAIERKGIISISTQHLLDSNEVEIRIKDSGEGIPAEILPRIFEPFFTTKEVGKGTGLGLAITYGIIENHKGRISVESSPHTGTEFRICLPVRQA